jgi:hypothetical protein
MVLTILLKPPIRLKPHLLVESQHRFLDHVNVDTLNASLPHALHCLHHQRKPYAFSPSALIHAHSSNQTRLLLRRHERQEADDVACDGRGGAHQRPANLGVGVGVKGYHDFVELAERGECFIGAVPALYAMRVSTMMMMARGKLGRMK